MAELRIVIDASAMSPRKAAQWLADFEVECAQASSSGTWETGDAAAELPELEPLAVLLARWDSFNPQDAPWRRELISRLQAQGYTITPPTTRGGGGASERTYLKVVRSDGANAGFLNSSSFTFVRSRLELPSVAPVPVKRVGKYPGVEVSSAEAVEFVASVAAAFARATDPRRPPAEEAR